MAKNFRNSLKSKAILVDFDGGWYNWTRRDTKVEKEVTTSNGLARNAGRYLKNLFLGCDLPLHHIRQIVQSARKDHDTRTVPWEPGRRMLMNINFIDYSRCMQAHQRELAAAKLDLQNKFDGLIKDAQRSLGPLFNQADYPRCHEVISACYINHKFLPFADASDVRLDLDEEIVAQIQAEVEANQADQYKAAINSTWQRVYEVVETAHRNLAKNHNGSKGTGERFNTNWYDTMKELLPVLDGLNLDNDPRLKNISKKCEDFLANYSEEDLRCSTDVRKIAYDKAQSIFDNLSAIYNPNTGVL